jgi:hypothetical protein
MSRWRMTQPLRTVSQYIATQTGQIKTLGSPLLIMGGLRAGVLKLVAG